MSTNTQPIANDQIRSNFVFLIMPDGHKYGKIQTRQAIMMAKQEGFDLVQVSPAQNGQFPVAKMLDLGKLRYKQSKQSKQHHHHDDVKEIKFGINIASHDLEVKNKKVAELLHKKYKVKYILEVKGRQKAQMGEAVAYMKSLLTGFDGIAIYTPPLVNEGKIIVTLNPKGHN